jgi:prepilin-type N-terminal cleavage/methylation domain-containing protein
VDFRRGFTLMEIVLAIALTSVVMYLLMTAIELYMIRVDSSRNRVESAQLARALLDRMASDLTATRLYATPIQGGGRQGGGPSGQGPGGGASGGQGGNQNAGPQGFNGGAGAGGSGGSNKGGGSSGGSMSSFAGDVQGLYGTAEELRIDRAAYPNWQRAARPGDPLEPATTVDMPVSVRYYYVEGDRLTADEFAKRGVSAEETATSIGGLYREVIPTAAIINESNPLAGTTQYEGSKIELLAPEVVKVEFVYFRGQTEIDVWDSFKDEALPSGVEVRLTLYEPAFQDSDEADERSRLTQATYRENELVEYRRFVRMPSVSPPQPAEALMPIAGQNNGNNGGRPGGDRGNGQGGGGEQGGAGGRPGGNNANQ